jgi:hypothetical protein
MEQVDDLVGDWFGCVHSGDVALDRMDQGGPEMIKYKQQGENLWRGQQTVQT